MHIKDCLKEEQYKMKYIVENECKQSQSSSSTRRWEWEQILLWILSLKDGTGNHVFEKYKDTLKKELYSDLHTVEMI